MTGKLKVTRINGIVVSNQQFVHQKGYGNIIAKLIFLARIVCPKTFQKHTIILCFSCLHSGPSSAMRRGNWKTDVTNQKQQNWPDGHAYLCFMTIKSVLSQVQLRSLSNPM